MNRLNFAFNAAVFSAAISLATQAYAEANTLYLLQSNPNSGALGNTLTIDQSAGSNTRIAGDDSGLAPAQQIGDGNQGSIVIEGQDISILFSQTGDAGGAGQNNSATISAIGTGLTGDLSQAGTGNSAALSITGTRALGRVSQIGDDNDGELTVNGTDLQGELIQTGDGNVAALTVTGSSSNVSYEIIGNNTTTVDTGPSVTTNAGTVVIRQTVLGSN